VVWEAPNPNQKEECAMYKKLMQVCAVSAVVLTISAAGFAAGQQASRGTIVAITEGVANIKGADGKTYTIKVEDIIAEDLKNR
jgi:hypothetical protein